MQKTVILPGMWGETASDELDEPQTSYGVSTHRKGYRKVVFSGAAYPEGDLAEQVRQILTHKERALSDLGGSMDAVTCTRYYVLADHLSRDAQRRIDEVRAEFFERPHYPASTMVGVSGLLGDALVEIDVEAEIPDDEWTVDVEADHREGDA